MVHGSWIMVHGAWIMDHSSSSFPSNVSHRACRVAEDVASMLSRFRFIEREAVVL